MTLATNYRIRSAQEYEESLRDGRSVFYRGEAVEDVTRHPVFANAVKHASLDYQLMAEDSPHRDLAVGPDGASRFFQLPRSSEDLLTRSKLIEAGTRVGKTLVVLIREIGTDALFALTAASGALGEPYASRIADFYEHCREKDLGIAVAQTDPKGDRLLRPSEQPDPESYLRIVERRPDGIVVRGAKLHTSLTVNANELIVLPTRAMTEADADYAVSFAIPLNTPGLRLVASPFLPTSDLRTEEHPLAADRKLVETMTVFEDVFVPDERVFMAGEWQHTGDLVHKFVDFHRFTAISYKLPLVDALVGAALLAAEANGVQNAPQVRDKLSWLISYAETLRALTHYSAHKVRRVSGLAVPDTQLVNIAKLWFANNLHTAFQYVQDIAGGLSVTYPAVEDLSHPEYGEALKRYLAGADGWSGEDRFKVMTLVGDLTSGEYAGYQIVLAIHAEGTLEHEKLTILQQHDKDASKSYARWLAGLEGGQYPPS